MNKSTNRRASDRNDRTMFKAGGKQYSLKYFSGTIIIDIFIVRCVPFLGWDAFRWWPQRLDRPRG